MRDTKYRGRTLISLAVAAAIMGGCVAVPKKPAGSDNVGAKRTPPTRIP